MKTILTYIFLIVTCIPGAYAQMNLDSGLIAYYPLDGNTQDFSGNNHNGVTVQSPVISADRFTNTNGCYWFNGNGDYIRVKKETTLEPKNAVSVSAWVYAEDLSSWLIVTSKRYIHSHSPGNSYILFAAGSAGQTQYWAFGVGNKTVETFAVDENMVQTKKWVHLTGTYDNNGGSGNIKLYVNGNLISKATADYEIAYSDSSLRIGMAIPGPSKQFFRGKIDDVRIYNRALSSSEVFLLYSSDGVRASTQDMKDNEISFDMFPNPAETELTISLSGSTECKLEIVDVLGKKVIENQISEGETVLNISELPSGIYYARLIGQENIIHTKKIIKN